MYLLTVLYGSLSLHEAGSSAKIMHQCFQCLQLLLLPRRKSGDDGCFSFQILVFQLFLSPSSQKYLSQLLITSFMKSFWNWFSTRTVMFEHHRSCRQPIHRPIGRSNILCLPAAGPSIIPAQFWTSRPRRPRYCDHEYIVMEINMKGKWLLEKMACTSRKFAFQCAGEFTKLSER